MTENRFGYDERIDKIWFWKDGMRYQLDANNLEECVETLNTLNNALEMCKQENERLKQQIKELQFQNNDVEWLRNNTVWEQMPTNIRTSSSTTTVENPYCDKRKVKKR